MNLLDREHVQGTENPAMYIARRERAAKDGRPARASKRWVAVYFDGKQQRCTSHKTRIKPEAIRRAQALHQQLVRGDPDAAPAVITVDQLVADYLSMLDARGRSKKTINKYERVLKDFAGVCEKGLSWKREKSPKTSSGNIGSGP